MAKRMIPVEVVGYVNKLVWTVDIHAPGFRERWMSVRNENYDETDVLPWEPDSCPF